MEKLHCYASGDGALHFAFLENGKATSRKVTLEDAQQFLLKSTDAAELRLDNWRAVLINTLPALVANISRIDEKTLSVDGQVVEYAIDPDSLFWQRDRHCMDHCLTLKTEHNGESVKVKNYSMRSAVRHFINNEEQLQTPA